MKSIKRFVIGLVGLSALYGTPAQAEKWVYVTQRDDDGSYKTTYSIDVDSFDSDFSDDDRVRIWQKKEYERSDVESDAIFSLYDFDCAKKEMNLFHWEHFVDNAPFEMFSWEIWNSRTQSVLAGSVSEEIFKAACALDVRP